VAAAPVPAAAGPLRAPSLPRRLACFVYEGVLLFGVVMIAGWLFSTLSQQRHALQGRALLQGFLFVVFAVYFTWFWSHGGQTLAMKTWRIRLVAKNGHGRLAPSAALARFLYALVLVPSAIGILWAMVDRDRQFLHDRLAGSLLLPVP
jgi:uncharacterized RDD family membrane protein YckC